ncbi:hypothetical protein GGTG_08312 [Gaeumannomyces tritici R3-111a-1]|uniref:Uncharacterized protein n=1 Tax=Gaeumannomyces tritici (strain R3-111a-1) TaxID=644352 RepID=J3P476_GAET3|nr:hypothetical protein GGTG_08312 [Gaeumannomyces tritici R3-111a-1]EJT74472.1 hypothetical protein GGTG_08312 [Gaeumannomyces tritici R3-111a-1]
MPATWFKVDLPLAQLGSDSPPNRWRRPFALRHRSRRTAQCGEERLRHGQKEKEDDAKCAGKVDGQVPEEGGGGRSASRCLPPELCEWPPLLSSAM